MEIKRKIEMLIATKRRYIVRRSAPSGVTACAECGAAMATADQAANFFGVTQRRVFRIVEAEAAHFAETEAGAILICLKSLAVFLETNGR